MPTLADIRAQNPQYNDLSDQDLSQRLHAKFYSDMPFEEFTARLTPGYAKAREKADETILDPRIGMAAQGASFGFADELDAATAAALTGMSNVGRRITGQPIPYTMGEAYRATVDADRAQMEKWTKDNPPWLGFIDPYAFAGGFTLPFGQINNMLKGVIVRPVTRAATMGAGAGGLMAAGSSTGDLTERAASAPVGAGLGAATGGAMHAGGKFLASGPLKRMGSAVSEALSRMATDLGVEPGAPPTPAQAARGRGQALETVSQAARRLDPTGQKLDANPIEGRGKPVTGAEALGREMETQLKVAGRRSGATPDALEAMLRERAAEMPGRTVDDFAKIAGINPAEIEGDFAAQTARLRANAAPLYDEAYAFDGPIVSDKLVELLKRPSMKAAKARAFDIIEEEGGNPEDVGFFRMPSGDVEVRGAGPSKTSHAFPIDEADAIAREIELAKAEAYSKGSGGLADYVVSKGGIKDDRGDVMATIGARGQYPGLLPAKGGKKTIDDLITSAVEDGKFPGFTPDGRQPTRSEFLDALDADIRRLSGSASDEARDVLNYWESHGVDVTLRGERLKNHLSGREESRGDALPTMRAWDYIKRGLDDVVEAYRDGTTRKLNLDTRGRAIVSTLNQVRDELTNPTKPWGSLYGSALNAGGEPLRLESAFRDAGKLMSNTVRMQEFNERISKMSQSQMDALRAGIVADARDRAASGRVRLNNMLTKAYEQKLIRVFGEERGRALIQRIQDERFLLTHGQRMTPGIGSDTSETLLADKEQQETIRSAAQAINHIRGGRPVSALIAMISDPVGGIFRGAQMPVNRATRDALGELLMLPPSQLASELRAYAAARGRPYLGDTDVEAMIQAMKETASVLAKTSASEQAGAETQQQ